MSKNKSEDTQSLNVHVRFSKKDVTTLDGCAKMQGVSRSAYVRDIVLAHMAGKLGDLSVNNTEKIIRTTMEKILDAKLQKDAQTLRSLVGEIQRANQMQLKSYIETHPGLDKSEYINYYYQSKKEAYDIASGKRSFSSVISPEDSTENVPDSPVPDWMKIMTEDE